ncbi:hypothetical protein CF326_g9206 [Tilletia indica]|nr:hypothetical protein CF326_g9206 [Tilletia indica]
MEALYNCTVTGDIQVNNIVKQPGNRYHTVDAEFAMESTDELKEAVCTAFSASNYTTPLLMHITGGFHGFASPKITIQTLEKLYGENEVPETYNQQPIQVSGVGKIDEVNEVDRYILIFTSAYDRGVSSSLKRSAPTTSTSIIMAYTQPNTILPYTHRHLLVPPTSSSPIVFLKPAGRPRDGLMSDPPLPSQKESMESVNKTTETGGRNTSKASQSTVSKLRNQAEKERGWRHQNEDQNDGSGPNDRADRHKLCCVHGPHCDYVGRGDGEGGAVVPCRSRKSGAQPPKAEKVDGPS